MNGKTNFVTTEPNGLPNYYKTSHNYNQQSPHFL